jgi:hypothetical protein
MSVLRIRSQPMSMCVREPDMNLEARSDRVLPQVLLGFILVPSKNPVPTSGAGSSLETAHVE